MTPAEALRTFAFYKQILVPSLVLLGVVFAVWLMCEYKQDSVKARPSQTRVSNSRQPQHSAEYYLADFDRKSTPDQQSWHPMIDQISDPFLVLRKFYSHRQALELMAKPVCGNLSINDLMEVKCPVLACAHARILARQAIAQRSREP